MNSRSFVPIAAALLINGSCLASTTFMDILTLTPGVGAASFTASLAGVAVTGTLAGDPSISFNAPGPGIGPSTIINDSPQWSFGTVYTPTSALDDRVGFSQVPGGGPAMVTVTFATPMTDLIFHTANLDFSSFSFAPTVGLTGVTLLSGNGGAGDGLAVGGPVVFDLAPATADGTPPAVAPPLAGPRSAYGSVLLSGTYTSVDFLVFPGAGIDNAEFTFSVPEPGRTALFAMGAMGMLVRRRRRRA